MSEFDSKKKKLEDEVSKSRGSKVTLDISGKNDKGLIDVELRADEDSSRSTSSFTSTPLGKGSVLCSGSFEVKDNNGDKRVFLYKETSGRFNQCFSKSEMKELEGLIILTDQGASKKASVSSLLDRVATSLENKGLLKEASAIDTIANTIEAYDIDEKPLVVKITDKDTIKADTMTLISQLKQDIGKALTLIGRDANSVDTNSNDQNTDKTEQFVLSLRKELEKVKAGIGSKDNLFNGVDVKKWKEGESYDISKIYSMCLDIINRSKGYSKNKSSVEARDLLDLIVDTYDKA
jgi:hypothetical protein